MNPATTHPPPRGPTPGIEDDAIGKRFAAGDERALAECHSQFGCFCSPTRADTSAQTMQKTWSRPS